MSEKFVCLSLGWGVQSFTLAVMAALGEIEPVDCAIHADTMYESKLTYDFAEKWTPWLEVRGVRVVTVRNKMPVIVNRDRGGEIYIPAFTDTENGGQLRRQCTGHWKIAPMRRWMQANRDKKPIELWLGISLDEYQRMRDSDVKYITHRWPLIERRMTRSNCMKWLESRGIEVPPKSACTFCPFHNTAGWRQIKNTPEDWAQAVKIDKEIRKVRPPFDLFVHPSRRPLDEVDFRTAEEKGQLSLWDAECSGICGV